MTDLGVFSPNKIHEDETVSGSVLQPGSPGTGLACIADLQLSTFITNHCKCQSRDGEKQTNPSETSALFL